MTDTERNRVQAICEVAGVSEIDDLSDGFHTFRQLYYQRMMLFATIVKQNKDRAWKSLRHEDGELCFAGGWFIVGIDTPEGTYTYHYEDKYFSLFDCKELERGKHWDGHTEKDVIRLLSLPSAQPVDKDINVPTNDIISRQAAIELILSGKVDDDSPEWVGVECPEECNSFLEWAAEEVGNMPSAERKTGRWIHERLASTTGGSYPVVRCSVCSGTIPFEWETRFCPNCGAEMESNEDG